MLGKSHGNTKIFIKKNISVKLCSPFSIFGYFWILALLLIWEIGRVCIKPLIFKKDVSLHWSHFSWGICCWMNYLSRHNYCKVLGLWCSCSIIFLIWKITVVHYLILNQRKIDFSNYWIHLKNSRLFQNMYF